MDKTPTDKTDSAHHTVPKFYLKGFRSESGQLTKWDRATGKVKRASVKFASTAKGYYTILDKNKEETDVVENLYMKVEDGAKPIFEKMMCVFPYIPEYNSEDRMIISQYLAMQTTRTKAFRRRSQLICDNICKQIAMLKLAHKKTPLSDIEFKYLQNPHQFGEICQSQDSLSVHELDFADEIQPFFYYRPWIIVVFDEPSLITSDTPVFILPNDDIRGYPNNGLAISREYWFPLDSKHLLILGDPLCAYPFKRDIVLCPDGTDATNTLLRQCCKASNDMQITNCHMEAYGQMSLLRKYDGKPLPKNAPFYVGGNNSFNSYYNEAKMDMEPILGHGTYAREMFASDET